MADMITNTSQVQEGEHGQNKTNDDKNDYLESNNVRRRGNESCKEFNAMPELPASVSQPKRP